MQVISIFSIFLLLSLPWVNPFAPGPSPAIAPWLVSMACAAGVALLIALHSNKQPGNLKPSGFDAAYVFGASLLAAGLISSGLALLQYFDLEAAFAPLVNATEPGYAFANLRQRNQFASLTNISLAALLWLTVQKQQVKVADKTRFIVWQLAAVGLLVVGNAISSSRTGLFQLLLLCALYVI